MLRKPKGTYMYIYVDIHTCIHRCIYVYIYMYRYVYIAHLSRSSVSGLSEGLCQVRLSWTAVTSPNVTWKMLFQAFLSSFHVSFGARWNLVGLKFSGANKGAGTKAQCRGEAAWTSQMVSSPLCSE